ncbi:hypothetical protein [Filimonas effusa]|uniref:Uncharacterized protein n=1 Tax=Filimonas effusa TaxID=2508721 RepID=A0A4Q1D2H6_9BACT|nr:hypothetical protein [Filimonas effusa]RXK81265.1 hypothetical protein ESB13_20225 [Filimonas effusa]
MLLDVYLDKGALRHLRLTIGSKRLLFTGCAVFPLCWLVLWLFSVAYFHLYNPPLKLIFPLTALLTTVFIFVLSIGFLIIKVYKRAKKIKPKCVWITLLIHVVIIATEYLGLYAINGDVVLAAYSIAFQIISVGLARMLCNVVVYKIQILKPEDNCIETNSIKC